MCFTGRVLSLTSRVPRGRITTYGEIARSLGNIGLSRAVGNALNKNPDPVRIPCHRVIRSNGDVGGFNRGVVEKIRLLRGEGIVIEQGRVRDFEGILVRDFGDGDISRTVSPKVANRKRKILSGPLSRILK